MRAFDWMDRAECRGMDFRVFFFDNGSRENRVGAPNLSNVRKARAICGRCPVRRECAEWVFSMEGRPVFLGDQSFAVHRWRHEHAGDCRDMGQRNGGCRVDAPWTNLGFDRFKTKPFTVSSTPETGIFAGLLPEERRKIRKHFEPHERATAAEDLFLMMTAQHRIAVRDRGE